MSIVALMQSMDSKILTNSRRKSDLNFELVLHQSKFDNLNKFDNKFKRANIPSFLTKQVLLKMSNAMNKLIMNGRVYK